MKQKIKAILEEERGVSPVIGVILMVAITVILAAVIGTFVLNLGGNLSSAPQAQIGAEDASQPGTVPAGGSTALMVINHDGGDQIADGDYSIRVSTPNSNSFEAILEGGSNTNRTYTIGGGDIVVGIEGGSNPGDIGVGDQVVIAANDDAGTSDHAATGEWGVQIIHVPSDSIIVDQTVTVQ